jgi:Ca2+-binding EF-hand superfamily protein
MKRFWVGFVLSVFGMASSQAIEIPGSSALAGVILNQYDNNTNDILDAGEWQTGSEDGYSKLDHNGDGKVSALLTFDKDDDKEVTEKEFHEEMDKLFKKLDTNSDAEVTKKELKLLPLKLL